MVLSSLHQMQRNYVQNNSSIQSLESQSAALQDEYNKEMRKLAADDYVRMLAAKNGDEAMQTSTKLDRLLVQIRASQKANRIKSLKMKALDLRSDNRLIQASMRKEINQNAATHEKIDHIPEQVLSSAHNFDEFVRSRVKDEPEESYAKALLRSRDRNRKKKEGGEPPPSELASGQGAPL